MDFFRYKRGRLFCEAIPVESLVTRFSTPLYIYSSNTIATHYRRISWAFHHPDLPALPLICYSVKANSNLTILKLMKKLGAGFDVVSGGELYRVLRVGVDPKKVVFTGAGKTDEEIASAIRCGVLLINIESDQELEVVNSMASRLRKKQLVGLRLNPDISPSTHRYIATGRGETKFGLDEKILYQIIRNRNKFKNIQICCIHLHIGSQITTLAPFESAIKRAHTVIETCRRLGAQIEWLDIGGGFGIWYKEKTAKTADEISFELIPLILKTGCKLIVEPGRFIVGNAGILVLQVLYVKKTLQKNFVICDAGMNVLIRPVLYDAYHKIWPVKTASDFNGESPDSNNWDGKLIRSDIVGPICETSDYLALDRKIPPVKRGDLIAIFGAGAYGYAMSSNYNSQTKPCEVLVSQNRVQLISRRERHLDLVHKETAYNPLT